MIRNIYVGDVKILQYLPTLFLEPLHQVDMKNDIKSSKHFFGYFNTLETRNVQPSTVLNIINGKIELD